MNDLDPTQLDVETLAIRTAQLRTDEMAHSDPIFLTSSFVYESAARPRTIRSVRLCVLKISINS